MKSLLLAAALVAGGLLASPASAQYYGGGYDRPPPPDYDYRPRRHRDLDDEDGYDRPRPRFDRRFGGMCVTARGSCPTGRPIPRGAPCGCEIPGFGYKRGAVD